MELSTGKKLGNLVGKLGLYHFFGMIGVEAFFYRLVYKGQLEEAKKFYKENADRVRACIDLFEDEQSKKIYTRAIRFRCTHLLRDRPFRRGKIYFNDLTDYPIKQTCMLDCGAEFGEYIDYFVSNFKPTDYRIVAFESDEHNYEILKRNVSDKRNIRIFPYKVWNENTNLGLTKAVAIDTLEECKEASFIKMDMCVATLNALDGAHNTISKNRPILTISLGDSNEDMLSVLEWVEVNLSEYILYCRHHSWFKHDTVLYAIPKEIIKGTRQKRH